MTGVRFRVAIAAGAIGCCSAVLADAALGSTIAAAAGGIAGSAAFIADAVLAGGAFWAGSVRLAHLRISRATGTNVVFCVCDDLHVAGRALDRHHLWSGPVDVGHSGSVDACFSKQAAAPRGSLGDENYVDKVAARGLFRLHGHFDGSLAGALDTEDCRLVRDVGHCCCRFRGGCRPQEEGFRLGAYDCRSVCSVGNNDVVLGRVWVQKNDGSGLRGRGGALAGARG
jgi:hypothetical protein